MQHTRSTTSKLATALGAALFSLPLLMAGGGAGLGREAPKAVGGQGTAFAPPTAGARATATVAQQARLEILHQRSRR
jgi:hypothetical protein